MPPDPYASISPKRLESVDALVEQTNPGLYEKMERRVDRDKRAEKNKVSAAERIEIMVEQFMVIDAALQTRAAKLHIDWKTGLTAAATLTLPLFFIFAGIGAQTVQDQALLTGGFTFLAAGIIATVYFANTDVARFARKRYKQDLVNNFRKIRPSREEIRQALVSLSSNGWLVGRKLNVDWLYNAVELG